MEKSFRLRLMAHKLKGLGESIEQLYEGSCVNDLDNDAETMLSKANHQLNDLSDVIEALCNHTGNAELADDVSNLPTYLEIGDHR